MRQRLQIIVAQYERGDFVGHLRQQHIAGAHLQAAIAHRDAQRDLDVDLHVGGVHAGRIVDGIGVEPHPAQRRLDAAALRHAEIGAFADHLAAQVRCRRCGSRSLARSPAASSLSSAARI